MGYGHCVVYECYEYWNLSHYNIARVYTGEDSYNKAVKEAIALNIEEIKETYRDVLVKPDNYINDSGYLILINEALSEEDRLREFIRPFDKSGGNYRYSDCEFHSVSSCEID